ncbi:MAG: hypothetical protein WBR23_06530 [Candidatus Dormiibacterota bacterium]
MSDTDSARRLITEQLQLQLPRTARRLELNGSEHASLWARRPSLGGPVRWARLVPAVTGPSLVGSGPDQPADPAARLAPVMRVELSGIKAESPLARLLPE